jgi:hypothetical protein
VFEKISVIIPFQTDHGPRAEAFKWVKKFYELNMPEAEICLGIINGEEVNKSKAVNLAAKKAKRDIFVIADADVVYDPNLIVEALRLLQKEAWIVPFSEVYNVEKGGTDRLLNTSPKWPIELKLDDCTRSDWVYEGFAGKLFVITRENFEKVGGFDERFIGWGGEDDAFSHSVQTLCGKLVNLDGEIFHLWHPSSSYESNPNGKANANLLNRYERAKGNKQEMAKLIEEKSTNIVKPKENETISIKNKEGLLPTSPKSKICFAILVHEKRELVKQLIDNVRYYCPNSTIVLYNGGEDPNLCDGLDVPVCPSSRKLDRGWTTIYFLEIMEWLDELRVDYQYFINMDSDAMFIHKGYEEFIHAEMKDTDYMAIKLRIPGENWYIGNELKKDVERWKKFFKVDPLYGIFNVGQVISKPMIQSLLEQKRKERLKKALTETISFGTDEVLYVNIAKELGFRMKNYPNAIDVDMIRYRPYISVEEMISFLNNGKSSGLCHPVIRNEEDPARRLILGLNSELYTKKYKSEKYPWYKIDPNHYSVSLPIRSQFGHLELIVRSGSSLKHYWKNSNGKWYKTERFANGVTGNPIFFENSSGKFVVICQLESGGIGFWVRDNTESGQPWYGPSVMDVRNVEPIMGNKLEDDKHIIVYKENKKFHYWLLDKSNWHKIFLR